MSSEPAKVEVIRACRRVNAETASEASALLAGMDLIPMTIDSPRPLRWPASNSSDPAPTSRERSGGPPLPLGPPDNLNTFGLLLNSTHPGAIGPRSLVRPRHAPRVLPC